MDYFFKNQKKIEDFTQVIKIIDSLKETLEYYGRVGLAAPQIGFSRRIFIVSIMPTKDYPQLSKIGFRAYLNPEVLAESSEVNSDSEGCLSIFYATLYRRVERSSWVRLKYLDIKGEEQIEEINHPFHTRVILHENDHLDGKVFLQRMKEEDFSKLYWEENLDIRKRNSE